MLMYCVSMGCVRSATPTKAHTDCVCTYKCFPYVMSHVVEIDKEQNVMNVTCMVHNDFVPTGLVRKVCGWKNFERLCPNPC